MEVESTTRSAKERVAGFEDREGHRTPFAPVVILQNLVHVAKRRRRRNRLCCYCGAIRDSRNGLVQVADAEVRVPPTHREPPVAEQFRDVAERIRHSDP